MVDLTPNDPCGCGSGRRYAECHQPVFDADPGRAIEVAHRMYAREWRDNAASYAKQGLYRWLAEETRKRASTGVLLDIGCGLGNGIDALRSRIPKMKIIGIDENPECLRAAASYLKVEALNTFVDRIENSELHEGRYRASYRTGTLAANATVNLLQSHLLVEDPEFEALLDAVGPLDVITQWFCGIHKANALTEVASLHDIGGDADYRCVVEEAATTLAQKRLRKGGWLNIAIRVGFADPSAAIAGTRAGYQELIEGTDLEIRAMTVFRYDDNLSGNAIRVRSATEAINNLPTFAVSMMIEKVR